MALPNKHRLNVPGIPDDFIGTIHDNLEVIDWRGEKTTNATKLYTVRCNVCAKDSELYGKAEYLVTKRYMKLGHLPCGCAKRPQWTKDQQRVRAERRCKELDYTFVGFVEEAAEPSHKAKVILRCNKHNHTWNTSSLDTLHFSKGGCRMCANEVIGANFSQPLETLDIGDEWKGYTFLPDVDNRRIGGSIQWNYTCPVCSVDEYVKAGACSGIFKARVGDIKRGYKSCRCTGPMLWTPATAEFKVKSILADDGNKLQFVEFPASYTSGYSEITLHCTQHGHWTTTFSSVVNTGSRCPGCAKSGFDVTKDGWVYVLKIAGNGTTFVGYGVTNVLPIRLATHVRKLSRKGFEVECVNVFYTTGRNAWIAERTIRNTFERYSQNVEGFVREATTIDNYDAALSLVKALISAPIESERTFLHR